MKTNVKRFERQVTLAVGQTTTPEINIPGEEIIGFSFDSHLTGTSLGFTSALAKGGTFLELDDASGAVAIAAVALSKARALSQDEYSKLRSLQNFKIVTSSQSTTPSVITIITKQVS